MQVGESRDMSIESGERSRKCHACLSTIPVGTLHLRVTNFGRGYTNICLSCLLDITHVMQDGTLQQWKYVSGK
jgi:hypothetical protein